MKILTTILFGLAISPFAVLTVSATEMPKADTEVVTASGVGVTANDAEKNALLSAVQQVVGMFLDAETMIENEKLVHDQILSLSSGFVSSYELIQEPRQRIFDGLYEATVRAVVQKSSIAERLGAAHMIKVDIDAKDLWASDVTRIQSAQDGMAMLEKMLPELQLKLLKVELAVPADRSGVNPALPETKPDPDSSMVWCAWNIALRFDLPFYYDEIVPRLEAAFDAVATEPPAEVRQRTPQQWVQGTSRYGHFKMAVTREMGRWNFSDSLTGGREWDQFGGRTAPIYLNVSADTSRQNQQFKQYFLPRDKAQSLQQKAQGRLGIHIALRDDSGVIYDDTMPVETALVLAEFRPPMPYQVPPLNIELPNAYASSLVQPIVFQPIRVMTVPVDGFWISPEFRFDDAVQASGFNAWERFCFSDSVTLRYETLLKPEDLKRIKSVEMKVVRY